MSKASGEQLSDASVLVAQRSPRSRHQDPDGKKAKKASSCTARQPETPTGCESPACTGLDRGRQSTVLWDIVCPILPFVSAPWNARPREQRSFGARTTFPSRGNGAANIPQRWGAEPGSPHACCRPSGSPGKQQAFIGGFILFNQKSPCDGCAREGSFHWQK